MEEDKRSRSIKVQDSVYSDLLYCKRGNDTFNDVIKRLVESHKDKLFASQKEGN